MMILVKIHEGCVAVCDADLVGKKFEEGELSLDVSERFYGGEKVSREELKEVFSESTNLNLVGKETVDIALEEKVIKNEDVIVIQGVPHAQVYNIGSE